MYEVKSLNEECGVFGIWGHPQNLLRSHILDSIVCGHRGQEGAGILANDEGHLRRHRDTGLIADVFKKSEDLERLTGRADDRSCSLCHVRFSFYP